MCYQLEYQRRVAFDTHLSCSKLLNLKLNNKTSMPHDTDTPKKFAGLQAPKLNLLVGPTTSKRMLKETSPAEYNQANSMAQVGSMSITELMKVMKDSMADLLDEKLQNMATKADVEDIKTDVGVLFNKVTELAKENQTLKQKIVEMEKQREQDARNMK